MKKLINDIYKLTETTIVTPQNLVSNITLPNYKEINFKKTKKEIVCSMTEENGMNYLYYFDMKLKLKRALAFVDGEEIILFDREVELNNLLRKYDANFTKNVNIG